MRANNKQNAARAKRLSPDARRTALLKVGVALFGTRPYDAVSSDDIAEAAGVSAPLIQHYFGGKQGFFIAVVAHAIAELEADAAPNRAKPFTDLRKHLQAYFRFVGDHPHAVYLERQCPAGARAAIEALYVGYRRRTAALVFEAMNQPRPSKALRLGVMTWVEMNEAFARRVAVDKSASPAVAAKLSEAALFALIDAARSPVT
jgi:AcrR family transcriptional regulator